MKIIRDPEGVKIFFCDSEDKPSISSLFFIPSFFIWRFRADATSKAPFVVTRGITKFYDNLDWLMSQNYVFSEESGQYNSKTDTRLEFMSDQGNSQYGVEGTPRIVIEKKDEEFVIYYRVPQEESETWNYPLRERCVAFGPAHNGQAADNTVTGDSLQSDMIRVFRSTLENRRVTEDKEYVERYNELLREKQKKGKALGKKLEI